MSAGEPITFIVAVNDSRELKFNLLTSAVADSPIHQWLLVDNHGNARYRNISQLYCDAARDAKHDLMFFIHQDVYLPPTWERQMYASLRQLEVLDPEWGVVGAVGVVPTHNGREKTLVGHWRDPHQYRHSQDLPQEVQSLDEMWLGLRKRRSLSFDPRLPGFHCYGIDISLSAHARGLKSYALDAFVWHKHRDACGKHIFFADDSPKIRQRQTASFREEYRCATEYIRAKWQRFLPFHSTSYSWAID